MFKKGQSGNPAGRPKAAWTWAGILREVAEQEVVIDEETGEKKSRKQLIAEALALKAEVGDVQAIKEFGDRMDGKPKQNIGVPENGGKVTITIEDYGSKDNTST